MLECNVNSFKPNHVTKNYYLHVIFYSIRNSKNSYSKSLLVLAILCRPPNLEDLNQHKNCL